MASNKSASMVTKNTHKVVTILAYAFLEWVLILLLLMNSFFSYMIRRFAAYFRLKPPCPWCSRIDHHLLEPTKSSHPFKDLVCKAHAKEISTLTYCSNHRKLADSKGLCQECFCSETNANCPEDLTKCECTCCGKMLTMKENDGNKRGSDCEYQIISDVGSFGIREAADDDSNAEYQVNAGGEIQTFDSLNEGAIELGEKLVNDYDKARNLVMPNATGGAVVVALSEQHKRAAESEKIETEANLNACPAIQWLKSDLEAEQKARNDLYAELEAERSAAAIAANQTMAMITRLQQEKAAVQMEALQYQRVMEEQAEYDQQALQLLNELVVKREREKQELEKELDVYRERVSDYEAKDKALMMIKECGDLTSPSNLDSDSDVLSIDLNCGYEKEEEEGRRDISLPDCSTEWGAIEDSLEELDEERLSIMRKLKELEEKLLVHPGEEGKENSNQKNPNAELLCSQEVNLGSCCFVENHPKTMASVARSLLDLVVSSESESEDNQRSGEVGCDEGRVVCTVENGSKRLAIQKEMDHVYGRLQALEADTEFLRHCIASVSKGNHGANVLQEILEHLRELRAAEFCF